MSPQKPAVHIQRKEQTITYGCCRQRRAQELGDAFAQLASEIASDVAIWPLRMVRAARSVRRLESVPDAGRREQQLRARGVTLELLPQLAHEHAQVLRVFHVACAPHFA